MNGNFHPNSGIDKSVKSLYKCRIVSLYNHLQTHKNRNKYVSYVYQQEESQSIRVGKELINKNNVVTTPTDTPKQASKYFLRQIPEEKPNSYKQKVKHGYFRKTTELDHNIDNKVNSGKINI